MDHSGSAARPATIHFQFSGAKGVSARFVALNVGFFGF
jgi:hypothetical protein